MNEEDAERALDVAHASADSDQRAAQLGMPLADFECPHGRLINGEKCEHCERRSMLDDLRPMADNQPPEPVEPADEVPCHYCGMPAPRRGPHAGRCPDHQDQPSKTTSRSGKKKRKTGAARKPRVAPEVVTPWQQRYDAVTARLAVKLAARGKLDVECAELLRELNELLPDGIRLKL